MDAGSYSSFTSSSSPAPPSERGKIFVGGISAATTNAELRDAFESFGEVTEAVAVRDRITGKGRGFGFVLFVDPAAADRAVEAAGHAVRGRPVEVKRAMPRGERYHAIQHQYPNPAKHEHGDLSNSNTDTYSGSESRAKKIFVGGLPSNLTEDDFRKYFEKFGMINDVVVMIDHSTCRPRGFGFITFDSEEAVENVLRSSYHELNSKSVEVKIAVPKDGSKSKRNGTNWNLRMTGSRGSTSHNFQSESYPTFSPRYGGFPGYPYPPYSAYAYGAGGYYGGPYSSGSYSGPYSSGSYSGPYYGAAFGNTRSSWHFPGLVSPMRNPLFYGNYSMYSSYVNNGFGGYAGMAGEGYHRTVDADNGNHSQVQIAKIKEVESKTMPRQVEDGTSDAQ